MSIVLIGPPGAGVAQAAQALAARLGTTVRDTDQDVERQAGKPVSDIFIEDGEDAFRELERLAAVAALAENGPDNSNIIVALGSGAVLDESIQERLNGRTVVYLAADFGTVVKHAGLDRPRVVLPGNPRGRLRAMLDERARTYQRLATITVHVEDARDYQDLAELIDRALIDGALPR